MSLQRVATFLLDASLLAHALARFELSHHGYPLVSSPQDLAADLVPSYLSRVPSVDPWERPYAYLAHRVLVIGHPKAKSRLTDSYELSGSLVDPATGQLRPVRIFNGTTIEAPARLLGQVLSLRVYPRYPGETADVRAALRMFGVTRPLALAKLAALRAIEDLGDPSSAADLLAFLKFNEPLRLRSAAVEALERFSARKT